MWLNCVHIYDENRRPGEKVATSGANSWEKVAKQEINSWEKVA
jgi:hypothetical protein